MIKIAVVEDNLELRNQLQEKLSKDFEVLFTASHGKDMIEELKLSPYKLPDVILMDIQMPEMNGIDSTDFITSNYPSIKVIMLTIFGDDGHIIKSIEAGAKGYILKQNQENIKDNIIDIINGGAPMTPSIAFKALTLLESCVKSKKTQNYILTKREVDVLKELSKGSSYKEIALELSISPATVKKHLENTYKKLHVRNKVEAIQKSGKLGLF